MSDALTKFVAQFNAGVFKKSKNVFVTYSKLNIKILQLFVKYGCIRSFFIEKHPLYSRLIIRVIPVYVENLPLIKKVTLISKPSFRQYWAAHKATHKFFKNSCTGFFVMSTVNGLRISNELLLENSLFSSFGGEVLLRVEF